MSPGSMKQSAVLAIPSFAPISGTISLAGIQRDLEALLHPGRDRLAQLGQALRLGVAMVGRHVDVVVQRLEDVRMRRQVGVADSRTR